MSIPATRQWSIEIVSDPNQTPIFDNGVQTIVLAFTRRKIYQEGSSTDTLYLFGKCVSRGTTSEVFLLQSTHPKCRSKALKIFSAQQFPDPSLKPFLRSCFESYTHITNYLHQEYHDRLPSLAPYRWITLPPRVKYACTIKETPFMDL